MSCFHRIMWAAAAGAAMITFAWASDIASFNAAVDGATAPNRIALGYLRTGNVELAAMELEQSRQRWSALVQQFGGNRPAEFPDGQAYTATLTTISAQFVGADIMLKSGRPEAAANALQDIRRSLYELRRKSNVFVLADCVLDANAAFAAFAVFDEPGTDWKQSAIHESLRTATARYQGVMDRCDALAPSSVRADPEFRRLVDGIRNSLTHVPRVIATQDGDLFHRLIGELRAFDNLLAFRFG